MIRGLLVIVLLAALGWSGYWWIGATAYQAGLNGWLASQRNAGWKAESETLRVIGFPNRFDTHISDLRLADPYGNWSWRAPQLQILSLSYTPNHIIAVWPGTHRITTRGGSYDILGDLIRGSVVFAPDTKLTLDRSTIEISNAQIGNATGPAVTVESAILSTRRSASPDAPEFAHDFGFDFKRIRLPEAFVAALRLKDTLPREIAQIDASTILRFDGPWDRTTLSSPPDFLGVDIEDFSVAWGQTRLQATGHIDITRRGFADGKLALDVQNWRALLRALQELGAIDVQSARSLESGLGLLAGLGGNPNRLKVPLDFKNNRTFIGPFDIGPAPTLIQRQ